MSVRSREDKTLEVADHVAESLLKLNVPSAVIGAVALAVRNYPRATEDIDLATDTDPFDKLRKVATTLAQEGFTTELNEPDVDDPLGGVLTITGPDFDPVQIVNFCNPYRSDANPGAEAIAMAEPALLSGTNLRTATTAHLIALKLYGGGLKGRLDVIELIERNPDLKLPEVRAICGRFGLADDFDTILKELGCD